MPCIAHTHTYHMNISPHRFLDFTFPGFLVHISHLHPVIDTLGRDKKRCSAPFSRTKRSQGPKVSTSQMLVAGPGWSRCCGLSPHLGHDSGILQKGTASSFSTEDGMGLGDLYSFWGLQMISSWLLYGCPRAELFGRMGEMDEQEYTLLCRGSRFFWPVWYRGGDAGSPWADWLVSSSLLKHKCVSLMSLCKESTSSPALSIAVLFFLNQDNCVLLKLWFSTEDFLTAKVSKLLWEAQQPLLWARWQHVFVCFSVCTAGSR